MITIDWPMAWLLAMIGDSLGKSHPYLLEKKKLN